MKIGKKHQNFLPFANFTNEKNVETAQWFRKKFTFSLKNRKYLNLS